MNANTSGAMALAVALGLIGGAVVLAKSLPAEEAVKVSQSSVNGAFQNSLSVNLNGVAACDDLGEAYGPAAEKILRQNVDSLVQSAVPGSTWTFFRPQTPLVSFTGRDSTLDLGGIEGVVVNSSDPTSMPALNNLGYAILAGGCKDGNAAELATKAREAAKNGVTVDRRWNGDFYVSVPLADSDACKNLVIQYGKEGAAKIVFGRVMAESFSYFGKDLGDKTANIMGDSWMPWPSDTFTERNASKVFDKGKKLFINAGHPEISSSAYVPFVPVSYRSKADAVSYGVRLYENVCKVPSGTSLNLRGRN